MYEETYPESRTELTEVEIFSLDVNRSITLQSLQYMQIRVKLFVLNENAAKQLHLHLDPCQSPSRHMGSTPRKITQ